MQVDNQTGLWKYFSLFIMWVFGVFLNL